MMLISITIGDIALITVEKSDPLSPDSQYLIEKLSAELAAITGDNGKSHFAPASMDEERSLWALAKDQQGKATGCGAIRPLTDNIAELKRMFSDRSAPGIGDALLVFLETAAQRMGYGAIWLATRRVNQRAIHFYEKNGYARIANYGPYKDREETVCFSKAL